MSLVFFTQLRESSQICTLGLSGDPHKGPVPTLASLPGLGRAPLTPTVADFGLAPNTYYSSHPNDAETYTHLYDQSFWHTSCMNDQLLVPSLRHLIIDNFVPAYKVRTGDRFHKLITSWLMFRLELPIARHLKRLTLEGWKDESIIEIQGTNELGSIVGVDGNMRGGKRF